MVVILCHHGRSLCVFVMVIFAESEMTFRNTIDLGQVKGS